MAIVVADAFLLAIAITLPTTISITEAIINHISQTSDATYHGGKEGQRKVKGAPKEESRKGRKERTLATKEGGKERKDAGNKGRRQQGGKKGRRQQRKGADNKSQIDVFS